MECNYCGTQAEWVENKEIYGKNYGKSYMCWLCRNCGAYVGCHENSKRPLGIMANKELRELRMQAHQIFDTLWKTGQMGRSKAYRHLAKLLNMETKDVHIAMFNEEQCKKVIELLKNPK